MAFRNAGLGPSRQGLGVRSGAGTGADGAGAASADSVSELDVDDELDDDDDVDGILARDDVCLFLDVPLALDDCGCLLAVLLPLPFDGCCCCLGLSSFEPAAAVFV